MGENKASEKTKGPIEFTVSPLRLNIEKLKTMTSGSCIITSGQISGNKLAVCKDGDMIKIFKIIEEPK